MTRLNRALVALSVCAGVFVASPLVAQQTQPPLKPILSGKFVPPIRGQAEVLYTKAKVTYKGKEVISTMQVKNISQAPIAGFKCDETWYDKQSGIVPGGTRYVHKSLFQPGEVITITLTDERDPRMYQNQYLFSHANGSVKAKSVAKF